MIFLRQSYNIKPPRWGSPADIEYAIKVNAEKVYDVDPDSIVLCMPLFWGLPCLDYSGKRNDGVNHGAYYKDGELEFDGVGDYVGCGNDGSLDITDTITVKAQIETVSNKTRTEIIDKQGSWMWSFLAGGKPRIYLYGTSPAGHKAQNTAINDGIWHHIGFTYDKDAGTNNLLLYVGGKEDGSHTVTGSITVAANDITIGKHPDYATDYFDGSINEAFILNIVLIADQIALFHALPYGLYQPVRLRYYSWPASPSLSISALDGASLIDSFSLTQKHEIAIQELLGASSVETLNLTQNHLLVLQELLSSTFVDSIILIQKHLLAVQELSGAGVLDNVVLIQKHLLIIQELLSSGVFDNIDLTQKHLLALQELLSSGILDAVSLTQKHTIIVQELLSGGLLDNIVVTQKHLLVIQELLSSDSLDAINLTQKHNLSIQSLLSNELLDSIILIHKHMLALQNLLSIETLDGVDLTQKHLLLINDLLSSELLDDIEIDIGLIYMLLSQETEYNIALSQETEYNIALSQETEYNIALSQEGGGI